MDSTNVFFVFLLDADKHELASKKNLAPQQLSDEDGDADEVGLSTSNPQKLIDGYQNEPVVSLEESFHPLDREINQLSAQINEAKTKCHYPSEHDLTRDEAAALYLYSMKGDRNSVHSRLQRAWQSGDRAQIQPWLKFLKLVKSGSDKLPSTKAAAWQGMPYDERWDRKLRSDSAVFYTGMGLYPLSSNAVKEKLHVKPGSKTLLVGCESVDARVLTGYTVSGEKEVLVWSGVKLTKTKHEESDRAGSLKTYFTGNKSKYHCHLTSSYIESG